MIRKSVQTKKHFNGKLSLHRETVRALGESELATLIGGGQETNCLGESNKNSGCITGFLHEGPDVKPPPSK